MSRPEKKADQLDGRRRRSEQSREAIVDAILALLRAGNPRPGAQEIAASAGVSLRSVFRHFEDLDGLFTVATQRQRESIRHLFELDAPQGSLAQRIEALVAQRARLYEEIAPLRRAALRQAAFHPPLRAGLREANAALRAHLPLVFAPDLARLSAAEKRQLLDALEAASSWAYWETLRSDQGLPPERARKIMARTLRALVQER